MENKVILNLKMDISNLAGYEFGIEIRLPQSHWL